MIYRFLIAITGLLVLGATACGDDDDSSPTPTPIGEQGQAGLCADLIAVNASLQKVMAISPSTTVGQAEAMRDELDLSLTEMQEAGEG